jgi:glutamate synthase domain-containing protein 2
MKRENMHPIYFSRYTFFIFVLLTSIVLLVVSALTNTLWWLTIIFSVLSLLGVADYAQKEHSVLANYPIVGRIRFLMEWIRPELRQYFWESDIDAFPYSRDQRTMVYRRSKNIPSNRAFGSIINMYEEQHSWLNHSMQPFKPTEHMSIEQIIRDFRVSVGRGQHAYSMSLLNISGTSFGALSPPAIEALSRGAKGGGFAQNTGEGSLSCYHEAGGGDLVWQISSGYFGCRDDQNKFDPVAFENKARLSQVKMIEVKLSQGAKPGHGGILMGSKVNAEIAKARGIKVGEDSIAPAHHSMFSTPFELLDFVDLLRRKSGGKPVGIKLCIGHPWEFLAIIRAMTETKQRLDFITVDGSEGGTGAAPIEFTDHVGFPLRDAIVFVDNVLRGAGLREDVKIAASGKLVSAYDIIRHCALGSDWCNMARPFMFSIGCIQALNCASNNCPSGIATMNPQRYRVLDVDAKAERVRNFHRNTILAVAKMIGAAGLENPSQLTREHTVRRTSANLGEIAENIYPYVATNALLNNAPVHDPQISNYWNRVSGDSFQLKPLETI